MTSGEQTKPERARGPRFFTTMYPASSPPEKILRAGARQKIQDRNHKTNSVAALSLARRLSELFKFALASVSGFRLVPSAQAPRFGRARSREPRDPGLPFRLSPENFETSAAPGKQKTLRSGWLGRVRLSGLSLSLMRYRSHEPGARN